MKGKSSFLLPAQHGALSYTSQLRRGGDLKVSACEDSPSWATRLAPFLGYKLDPLATDQTLCCGGVSPLGGLQPRAPSLVTYRHVKQQHIAAAVK